MIEPVQVHKMAVHLVVMRVSHLSFLDELFDGIFVFTIHWYCFCNILTCNTITKQSAVHHLNVVIHVPMMKPVQVHKTAVYIVMPQNMNAVKIKMEKSVEVSYMYTYLILLF